MSITTSGTSTAGKVYSLVCFVAVMGSIDQPIITWLNPMNNPVPSDMITTTGSVSILTFDPLSASHAGTYTCRVVSSGEVENTTNEVLVLSEQYGTIQ